MARTVEGFAWYAYTNDGNATAPGPAEGVPPRGVLDAWPIRDSDYGIGNFRPGPTFLVVTRSPRPPRLASGWDVEPAELDEDQFRTEGGAVLLVRVVGIRETGRGPVQECEFLIKAGEGHRPGRSRMTPRHLLGILIGTAILLRLAVAASVGPGNDEAYHYLFAVHPDWSYFDHPPMLAVVEAAGLALAGGRASPFVLRLGFIALAAGSTWLMARLTARFFGQWAGFLAAFALSVTGYYGIAAAVFALPDGPLVFFTLLTLDRLAAAIESPRGLRPWAWVGLAWGGALLSKYHAVFLPAGAILYLATEPSARHWLRRPGPYLAVGIGLATFSPVVWWNANHGWASFAFQGGRALGSFRLRPDALAAAIGGQALYLFPWMWASLVVVLVRRFRRPPDGPDPPGRFLICQAVVPLAAFAAVASVRPVLPHWSLVGLLPLFPLLGREWADRRAADPVRMHRRFLILAALPAALGLLAVSQAQWGLLAMGHDPTADLFGWEDVSGELARRGLLDAPGTFLFTGRWYYSGQIALATKDSVPVLCFNRRHAQHFAYWSRPGDWVGRDGIFVGINDCSAELADFARFFDRVEPLGAFPVRRSGALIRTVHLYRCIRLTTPFPFGNSPSRRRPDRAGPIGGGRTRLCARAQGARLGGRGKARTPIQEVR